MCLGSPIYLSHACPRSQHLHASSPDQPCLVQWNLAMVLLVRPGAMRYHCVRYTTHVVTVSIEAKSHCGGLGQYLRDALGARTIRAAGATGPPIAAFAA